MLLISFVVCAGLLPIGDSNSPPTLPPEDEEGSNVTDSAATPQQAEELLTYKTLRRWSPNNSANALGMEILIGSDDVTEEQLKALLRRLSEGYDPAVILIYTSQEAYDQDKSMNYGSEYKRGYLLFFVRNTTGRGVYAGANEIRWFQEIGRFASKFGTTTPM